MIPSRPRLLAACALLLGAAEATHAAHAADAIQVNQLGFLPGSRKLAMVPATAAGRFQVKDAAGKVVLEGPLGKAATWDASGLAVRTADLSALRAAGTYRIAVAGVPDSTPFPISPDAYRLLDAGAIRAYTHNRAGIALDARVAGAWARPAGHPDDRVLVHPSAASAKRPAGTVIASPKGWYDAGDYNKYVVNSGISTYTLLAAYEHFPAWFDKLALDLPESGNGLPDLVNETLWNLDWLATMQDPEDGGVYHKLTNLSFDGMVMPDKATAPRYVVQKTTAAALDFAATLAAASRVLARFDGKAPGRSQRWLAQAESAWRWAVAHPAVRYRQPADVKTGEYGDDKLDDEFAWAAAELLAATGKAEYRDPAQAAQAAGSARKTEPDWGDVRALGWITLAGQQERLPEDAAAARRQIVAAADTLLARWQASPYRLAMAGKDFIWGSNAVVLNQGVMLVQAYRITGKRDYLDAAQSALDYTLGRNPLGVSYVTGFGTRSAMHPHHRPSVADGIAAPVPGWLVGGPNPGQQDAKDCKAAYAAQAPALSWLDDACSYASNEVAINWNAPLVYVAAALQVLER